MDLNELSIHVGEASFKKSTILRRAFKKHLQLVSDALFYISKADRHDDEIDNPVERAAIRACLFESSELEQAIEEAQAAKDALETVLKSVTK